MWASLKFKYYRRPAVHAIISNLDCLNKTRTNFEHMKLPLNSADIDRVMTNCSK